ncbi:putative tRNA pseudouridine synthase Pus10 [Trichoplax sp. H2]|nr:putative tRNA pseudouridine synthase Pus10 [Trichoplax sp. H2]|eukprot:RDD40314.1 putative tRNA pseudouridine synthase Pus10 [Trichoplax sp. H2]
MYGLILAQLTLNAITLCPTDLILQSLRLFEPTNSAGPIVNVLRRASCCARCILRFLGEKNIDVYQQPRCVLNDTIQSLGEFTSSDLIAYQSNASNEQQLNSLIENSEQKQNDIKEIPCATCLGVLQDYCDKSFVEKLHKDITESLYEYKDYDLCVSLPPAFIVREHSIWIYLQEQFKNRYEKYSQYEDIVTVKEAFKWICGGMLDKFYNVIHKYQSLFQVKIEFLFPESESDDDFFNNYVSPSSPPRKLRRRSHLSKKHCGSPLLNATSVRNILQTITSQEFRKYSSYPPKSTSESVTYKVNFNRQSIFMAGKCYHLFSTFIFHSKVVDAWRYNKYDRTISQTPWIIDGIRKGDTSVQELICDPIIAKVNADGCKFSSSGREDIDVRMLGKGRPFIAEILNPRSPFMTKMEVLQLQNKINFATDSIKVKDLQMVKRWDASKLKDGEENKTKTYSALVYCSETINEDKILPLCNMKELTIEQKTPLRVLHRRTLAVRCRMIWSMKTEYLDAHHFKLYLTTQAGTYIKEFVHGDLGRTKPNLCTLLNMGVDILELDVESVDLDWPPEVTEDSSDNNNI